MTTDNAAEFGIPAEAALENDDAPEAALWEDIPEKPTDEEIVRLRELLFKREIALLEKLRDLQDDQRYQTYKTSEFLAEAIQLRASKDQRIGHALEPVVDDIIKTLLRRRRGDFVDSLFPLMGPSIRKSIAETFRSMLENFSKSMEMAFSWKGLRWRFEAMRSGRPFSEIVMLNTLVYRVEQVFFTHSATGIPLAYAVYDEELGREADMVSSMFTAIQDFVRDCFTGDGQGDLESLRLGEHTILIEKSPQAYLACVVRGTPPASFREQLHSTLDHLLLEYADELTSFSGDMEPFTGATQYLEDCLSSRYINDDKKLPWWGKALPFALLCVLLAGAGIYVYYANLQEQRLQMIAEERRIFTEKMEQALSVLRSEPGLLITNVTGVPGSKPWEVAILKDSLAERPDTVLRNHGYEQEDFSFKTVPYISYDPAIIDKRVKMDIELPDSVTMEYDGKGTIFFRGSASLGWIVKARDDARSLPGVEHVDISGMRDPMMDTMSALVRSVEDTTVEFDLGKDIPVPQDGPKLQKAVDNLVELEKIVQNMGFSVNLTIYGHADAVGTEKRNYEISQARARTVAAMLYSRGSSMPVAMYAMGAAYPKDGDAQTLQPRPNQGNQGNQASRRVELRVRVMRSASADLDSLLLSQPR